MKYRPLFHPRRLLSLEMVQCHGKWKDMQKFFIEKEEKFLHFKLKDDGKSEQYKKYTEGIVNISQQHLTSMESLSRDPLLFSSKGTSETFEVSYPLPCRDIGKIVILRKIIEHSRDLIELFQQYYSELERKFMERSAWARDRKAFGSIFIPIFSFIIQMFGEIAELILREKNLDTSFSLKVFNVSGSLVSCMRNSQWKKALATFHAFVGEEGISFAGILSNKESSVFWANLPHFISNYLPGEFGHKNDNSTVKIVEILNFENK